MHMGEKNLKDSITIIGVGNMGAALARGLAGSPMIDRLQMRLYDASHDRYAEFLSDSRIKLLDSLEGISCAGGMVVLCVKPQDLSTVADPLKSIISNTSLVISVLAGTKMEDIGAELGHEGAIIRAMPNIAATVGYAATALSSNEHCSIEQKSEAEMIFNAVGDAYWTKESLMDVVTGLSGSGPAYIYMVIEALTDGGVKMGLPRKLAFQLSTQTVLGAAMLVKKTGIHPAILKEQVTTPAGTTISALHELEERGLRSMFVSAVETATQRSIFLGERKNKTKAKE